MARRKRIVDELAGLTVVQPTMQLKLHPCHWLCPEGWPCACNGIIQHTLHICSRPFCKCHSAERYDHEKRMRMNAASAPAVPEVAPEKKLDW